jgi:hypothetical protein
MKPAFFISLEIITPELLDGNDMQRIWAERNAYTIFI